MTSLSNAIITLDGLGNASFEDRPEETWADIGQQIAACLAAGQVDFPLRDLNGNKVGQFAGFVSTPKGKVRIHLGYGDPAPKLISPLDYPTAPALVLIKKD